MRIAFCTDIYLPQLSGIADSIKLLTDQLKKQGHAVRIYAPQFKDAAPESGVIRLPSYSMPGSKGVFLFVVPIGMVSDLKQFNPDIIHTHTFSSVGLTALYASWKLKIPLVGTDHTFPADFLHYIKLDYPLFRFLARKFASWYYNHCKYVTAPSQSMLNELSAYGLRVPTIVISNPIAFNLFKPSKNRAYLKKKYGIGKKAILIFGRISKEKNLDLAFDVFADVLKRLDVELVVIGEGPYQHFLENKSLKQGTKNKIRFFGLMRGEPLAEAINTADVYLITSTSDTQSMTTIQAMSCGLPVVGANAGGLPEYIQNNKTGFLIDPGNRLGFAEKLILSLTDSNLARKFGEGGRNSIQKFSPEQIAKRFKGVYNNAIQN